MSLNQVIFFYSASLLIKKELITFNIKSKTRYEKESFSFVLKSAKNVDVAKVSLLCHSKTGIPTCFQKNVYLAREKMSKLLLVSKP